MVSIVLPRKPSLVSDDRSLGPRIVMNSLKSTCPSPDTMKKVKIRDLLELLIVNNSWWYQTKSKTHPQSILIKAATNRRPFLFLVCVRAPFTSLFKRNFTDIPSLVWSLRWGRVNDKWCSCPEQLRLMWLWAEHSAANSLQLNVLLQGSEARCWGQSRTRLWTFPGLNTYTAQT